MINLEDWERKKKRLLRLCITIIIIWILILCVVVVVIVGCEMIVIIPPDRLRAFISIADIIIIRKRASDEHQQFDSIDSFVIRFIQIFVSLKARRRQLEWVSLNGVTSYLLVYLLYHKKE